MRLHSVGFYCLFIVCLYWVTSTSGFTFKISSAGADLPKEFTVYLGTIRNGQEYYVDSTVVQQLPFSKEYKPKGLTNGLIYLQVRKGSNRAEFIYAANELNMIVETDYWALMNGFVTIENSTENAAYAQLLTAKGTIEPKIEALESRLRQLSPFDKEFQRSTRLIEDSVRRLIDALNLDLTVISKQHKGTFVDRIMVPLTRLPSLDWKSTWASEYDSHMALMNEHYFDTVPLGAEVLNHYAFEDKIIIYLDKYTAKTTDGAQKGIDVIMHRASLNSDLKTFTYNLLLKNFLNFKTETLAKYLLDNYADGCNMNLTVDEVRKLSTMRSLMVGGKIPELYLPDKNDKKHSLHKYASENRYTIVFVWLSWCATCQKYTPKVEENYALWKKKGLGVYAISLDESKENWLPALEKFRTDHPNVCEQVPIKNSSVTTVLAVSTTPKIFIIDKDANVVAKDLYGEDLRLKLEELFK